VYSSDWVAEYNRRDWEVGEHWSWKFREAASGPHHPLDHLPPSYGAFFHAPSAVHAIKTELPVGERRGASFV
jgi:hypothetical protein